MRVSIPDARVFSFRIRTLSRVLLLTSLVLLIAIPAHANNYIYGYSTGSLSDGFNANSTPVAGGVTPMDPNATTAEEIYIAACEESSRNANIAPGTKYYCGAQVVWGGTIHETRTKIYTSSPTPIAHTAANESPFGPGHIDWGQPIGPNDCRGFVSISVGGSPTGSYGFGNGSTGTLCFISQSVAKAELTATVAATAATAGTAKIFSATSINSSTKSSGAGFNILFQVADTAAGAGAVNVDGTGTAVAALGASASRVNNSDTGYTFSAAGTKYYRACVDLPPIWTGVIVEADEGNNCGAWTAVTVTAAITPWVNMGCGPIDDSYNGSCITNAEPLDISCAEGEHLEGRSVYDCMPLPNNNEFRDARRCVADASCVPPPQPDLTATVAATTASVGVPIFFSASAINSGTSATGASFNLIWQVASSSDGTGAVNVYNASGGWDGTATAALAAGATRANILSNDSYTFPASAAGTTRYYRACADLPPLWTGSIVESNEGNNCGAWTAVTVSAPAPSGTCSPSSSTVNKNDMVTWTAVPSGGSGGGALWVNTGYSAAKCVSDTCPIGVDMNDKTCSPINAVCTSCPQGIGTFQTEQYTCQAVASPYTYVWTLTGGTPASGTTNPIANSYASSGTKTASVVITRNNVASAPISCSVTVSNAPPACSDGIDNDADGYTDFGGGDPSCTDAGDTTENPASPKATLSCTSPTPCSIPPLGTATLTYSGTNATSCTFADSGTIAVVSGVPKTRSVSPDAPPNPAAYDLYCSNAGEDSAHVFANVNILTPSAYISANPARVIANTEPSTISWSAKNVTSCSMTRNGSAFNPVPLGGSITPVLGTLATSSVSVTVSGQTAFKITCNGAVSTAVVNINGGVKEF